MEVIIVGAGAAGLMAAEMLSAKGVGVVVLEARSRLGGRINTIKDQFGLHCEAGAEFIHGNLQLTRKVLKRAGLKQIKVQGETYSIENGRLQQDDEFGEGYRVISKRLKELKSDISIATFLNNYLPEEKYAGVRTSFAKYVQGYDSANIEDASSFGIRDEMENEDDEQYRVENGYGGLINFLAEKSRENGCIIKTSAVVERINWQKNNAEVITSGEVYNAQKLIITVPIGVLRTREDDEGSIRFEPAIPRQKEAISNIGFGAVVKILLEFDEAFWFDKNVLRAEKLEDPFFFFANTFIPTWWTQYPDKSPLLVGWLSGPDAYSSRGLHGNEFLRKAIMSLSKMFNMRYEHLFGKLKAHKVCNWVVDPFCRGAYSYPTIKTKEAVQFLKTPLCDTLYFCGEALAESGTGTVDAALQSGEEIANKILSDL